MSNFITTFAGVASLALAALPMAALATAAHASPAYVRVADLNLNSADGLRTFEQRADAAAHSFCRDNPRVGSRIGPDASCVAAIRAEARDKLPAAQQAQLAHRGAAYAAR